MSEDSLASRPASPLWALAQLNEPFDHLVNSAFQAPELREALQDPALSADALRDDLLAQRDELVSIPARELQELAMLTRRLAEATRHKQHSAPSGWARVRDRVATHMVRLSASGALPRSRPLEEWLTQRWIAAHDRPPEDWLEQHSVLQAEIDVARRAYTAAVFERAIQRTLRTLVDQRTETSYSSTLTIDAAPGLAELTREDIDISSETAESLQRTMRGMGGGSIAVSGPRGVGKTTLLEAFRRGRHPVRQTTPQPQLAVLVSAPVAYDGRDFILHLFAQLCETVIANATSSDGGSPLPSLRVSSTRRRSLALFVSRLVSRAVLLAGAVLLVVVLFAPDNSRRETIAIGAILATLGLVLIGPGALSVRSRTLLDIPLDSLLDAAVITILRSLAMIALPTGAVLVILASVNRLPSTFVLWSAGAVLFGVAAVSAAHFLNHWAGFTSDRHGAPSRRHSASDDALLPIALRWRDRIHYQQRYTSGWSGGLTTPLGLELSRRVGTDATDQQLTFPDAVDAVRRFLQQATRDRDVLIGIDELDKIETPEVARRFLNEVKTIFGIEHCFYLVSVSEDAMTHFERRGMPLRDVLDSSFDEMFYMDCLRASESRYVLSQRVVGLPVPFLFLVHCISGGLPRDLIRATRALIEARSIAAAPLSIEHAAKLLASRDVTRKSRAARVLTRQFTLEPHVSNALSWIAAVQQTPPAASKYLARCEEMPASIARASPSLADGLLPGSGESEGLLGVVLDLALVLYFAATVLAQFSRPLSRDELRAMAIPERPANVDVLARARTAFSSNRRYAWELLSQFRDAAKIDPILPFPADTYVEQLRAAP